MNDLMRINLSTSTELKANYVPSIFFIIHATLILFRWCLDGAGWGENVHKLRDYMGQAK